MVSEDVIEKMKLLGLKEYEAKVYAALAVLGPSKASEIAKESGVPRPRVYDVLKELYKRGFVDISEGNPTYFRAVEPEKVIASLRDEYLKSAEEVIIKLKSYQKDQRDVESPIWYLQGEWNIKSKVEDLADRAEKEFITAFVDGKLALKFKKTFEKAKHKRLDVKILLLEKNRRYINVLSRFGEVTCVQLKKILNDESEDFRKVLAEALFSDETPYRVKGIFVRDGRESILVYEEKEILKGLIVRIPFIPLFQRMVVLYLIERSKH
ncbi:MAG: TrmB family transcriptional regulator [Thermococcus sp.]|nr:TrmB family transcriptional regulator [Thermococcus sp.]